MSDVAVTILICFKVQMFPLNQLSSKFDNETFENQSSEILPRDTITSRPQTNFCFNITKHALPDRNKDDFTAKQNCDKQYELTEGVCAFVHVVQTKL